jgi:NAD(P)-dependent dehydrogenase (short-subunit alcohol dehydrogenase family)
LIPEKSAQTKKRRVELSETNGVALVTGASRGLGAATALWLARKGYAVCVNYNHNEDKAQLIVDTIRGQGGKAIAVQADVSDEKQLEKLFAAVDSELGSLTALINNAGMTGTRCKVLDLDVDTIRRMIDTNITGLILCAREAVKRMAKSRGGIGGDIINVSSQAGQFGGNSISPYAATKAAVNTFTVGLSREVGPEGIRVNAVSPGIIDTGQADMLDHKVKNNLKESIPLGRIGHPDDVAKVVHWLLSQEASYLTGVIVPVAGGR